MKKPPWDPPSHGGQPLGRGGHGGSHQMLQKFNSEFLSFLWENFWNLKFQIKVYERKENQVDLVTKKVKNEGEKKQGRKKGRKAKRKRKEARDVQGVFHLGLHAQVGPTSNLKICNKLKIQI